MVAMWYPFEIDDEIASACLQGCRGRRLPGLYRQVLEMETGISDAPSGRRRDRIAWRGRWRRRRCRRTGAKLRLQGRDAGAQHLVLLARQPGHVLDRLELLALDQVEVPQPLLRLRLEHGVDLALDALRDASGIVHQAGDLVEETVAGLGHGQAPKTACLLPISKDGDRSEEHTSELQ